MISLALLLALASSPPAPTTASPPASPTSAAPWTAPPSFEPRWLSARPARAPQRIVTVAPSLTELVFALGAGARVVGVTQFDDFPPEVTRLPRIGGFLDPSVERILELRADLVIAAPNASNRVPLDRLVALGVPVLVVPGNGFADLFHGLRAIGEALGGAAPQRAEALSRSLADELRVLTAQARTRRRVALVYDRNPLILGGPGSFADTLITLLGAENVVKVAAEYPTYAREQLLLDAPEVIIDASLTHWTKTTTTGSPLTPIAHEPYWAAWRTLPAVARGQVYGVTGTELLRPGPRLVRGMRALAAALQGPPSDSSKPSTTGASSTRPISSTR